MNTLIRKRRPGYTLAELVVGLGSASLLMVGMGSTVYLAGRTLDHGGAKPVQTQQAGDALDDIALDLSHTTSFSERTAQAVTVQVPDRDNNDAPETIRYSWSGTAGDPLLVTHNGGTPATVAANVRAFNLTYLTRAVTGVGFVKGYIDDPNLVAWWKLDETSGTTANDTTTNANHGTLTNGPTWVTGYRGNALQLNGTNQAGAVPHKAVLTITSQLTFTAWVWINSSGNSGWRTMASKGSGNTYNYLVQTLDRKCVFGYCRSGTWYEVYSPNTLATQRWYHLAVTMEPDGTGRRFRLYEDGVEVANLKHNTVPAGTTQPLLLGATNVGEFWPGKLDDMRIYNRKLSASEIVQVRDGSL